MNSATIYCLFQGGFILKTAIVCEGGAMRGAYTSGVLQAFMRHDIWADVLVGVSAGAVNGISYVSKQLDRGFRCNVFYSQHSQYLGLSNYIKTGSAFGFDFLFDDIPNLYEPFHFENFFSSSCDYFAGAFDIHSGETYFFSKADIEPGFQALRASCAIPGFIPIVSFQGHEWLDGGIANPIPWDKALLEGCTRLLVILTRPRSYRKQFDRMFPLLQAKYKKYPKLIYTLQRRHLLYNKSLQDLARLEKLGKAIIVAPPKPLPVGRFGRDPLLLTEAYTQGYLDGQAILPIW